ncbi:MAG: nucleotidyltransferase domain-containing protein [Deltaproteobacteria bacterium]|nr:MAG: nucleotidyltransferase domain-containing protein [Deltaproteobacteria bacterium]
MYSGVRFREHGNDKGNPLMAQRNEDVIKIVRQFLDEIQKSYKIELAFLYGSYAKGASNEWSDIDIAIVSPDFSDDLLKERLILTKLAIPIDDRIEPKPFNKESFNPNDPLVYEITQNGLPLI